MEHIFETMMQKIGARLFAADAAGAVHDDILLLLALEHLHCHRQLLAEGIARYLARIFEMPHLVLVVIAHIHDDGIGIGCQLVELGGVHIPSLALHREGGILDTVGNDLCPHLYAQHPERFPVILDRDVQAYILQKIYRV